MTTTNYKKMPRLLMTLMLGLVSTTVFSQADSDKTITEQLHKDIAVLASDQFEGRAPGTRGEALTVSYLIKRLKEIGVSPGNKGSYKQQVPITTTTTTNQPNLTITGANQLTFNHRKQVVLFTPRQAKQASISNSELVFVGYGINAPERNHNDYANVDVTGKTVVMLINDPGFHTQDPNVFAGKRMTYYGRWDYKFEEAARQGAAGAIIIHETDAASYPWAVVENSWTGGQISVKSDNANAHRVQVEGWIQLTAAKELFKAAKLDFNALHQAASKPGFKAVNLNLQASATLTNSLSSAQSSNVVGLIKGSKRPDEYIIYSAHWDHLGKKDTEHGADIYNGAIDNATGVAAMLAIGERFIKAPPERSIVLLAVTAEESGLLGSKWYTQSPIFDIKQTVANINMDAMGVWGKTKDMVVVGMGQSDLDQTLATQAAKQGRTLKANPRPEAGYYFRSDHFPFARSGVPALYAKSGNESLGHSHDFILNHQKDYGANAYHKAADDYNPDWDLGGLVQDVRVLHAVGEAVSNREQWPQWSKDSEFGAKR